MEKKNSAYLCIVIVLLLLALCFQSCAPTGYGCKGRASWNDVVRKANRPY